MKNLKKRIQQMNYILQNKIITHINVDNVLLGRITAGDYIEQKKAEIAAQEKARAEAEAKRIAEEKAERERLEKERLKQEEENRKREDKITNPSPSPAPDTDPNNPDEPIDNDRDDNEDNNEETITTPPDNTGGGNGTPPKDGDGESPAPPSEENPSPENGGGDSGGNEPEPPSPPGGGGSGTIYMPWSTDTGNEYYLDTLYGTKPFSAQESGAFNSTIISNELSALQPVTSLNVAGFPGNDTAIKHLTAITHKC
ncbi:hypothetical protein [Treponema sp. OMZ 789]|nr:hypothetical protein [Treponema sp. OMZ 789]